MAQGKVALLLGQGFEDSEASAKVKDEAVVIDQNWITSRRPDDLEQFSEAFVEALKKAERAAANGEARQRV